MKKINKNKINLESFNNAINGIIYALKTEIKMKFHLIFAISILLFSMIVDISKIEIIIIIIMITLVISLELINTAIENTVDYISPEYSLQAKIIKDISAGAVLISALSSLAVAYLIFYDRIILFLYFNLDNFFKLFGRIGHVSVIIIFSVTILVIALKTYFNKGSALEGGMPSGHSAISFSILAIVFFLSRDIKLYILSTILAILVAQSRVKTKVHTVLEVVMGGILGFVVSTIILLIFYKLGK